MTRAKRDDILFDEARADDVRGIMESLGFTTEYFGASNHDVYHKKPVSNFEMHRALFGFPADEGVCEYYRDAGSRLIGDGCEKRFGPEDFYLYLTAHEQKHYAYSAGRPPRLQASFAHVASEAERWARSVFRRRALARRALRALDSTA